MTTPTFLSSSIVSYMVVLRYFRELNPWINYCQRIVYTERPANIALSQSELCLGRMTNTEYIQKVYNPVRYSVKLLPWVAVFVPCGGLSTASDGNFM
jgi:hypothetical protein